MLRLITVIVVLAILSITAYMKMLNFQSDARRETLKTIVATIHSVSGITYTKSLIRGIDSLCSYSEGPKDNDPFIEDIYTCYGYPTAHIDNVRRAFDLDSSLYVTNTTNSEGGLTASISFKRSGSLNYNCRVMYSDAKTTAETTRSYEVEFKDSDC